MFPTILQVLPALNAGGVERGTLEIAAAITETGATAMKDMGKVVGVLKAKFTGQMDFAKASALVKAALNG